MARARAEPVAGSGIRKRSLSIAGHRTSVSLEGPFWEELGHIADARGLSLQGLVTEIDAGRGGNNLSSALRLHVLETVRGGRASDRQPDAPAG